MYDEAELLAIKKVWAVFEDYILESKRFDLLPSNKFGYLIMVFGSRYEEVESVVIDSAEKLCELLLEELANDVTIMMKINPYTELAPEVRSIIQKRQQPYIDLLPDYAYLANPTLP